VPLTERNQQRKKASETNSRSPFSIFGEFEIRTSWNPSQASFDDERLFGAHFFFA